MQRVFVLDKNQQPLMPCQAARARRLLSDGKAAVFRREPFTIILLEREGGDAQPLRLKLDPGSKTTGIAMVITGKRGDKVIWAAELHHRGLAIKASLLARKAVRKRRRYLHCRFRPRRSNIQRRAKGWLAPSLYHRVLTVTSWVNRLRRWAPVSALSLELVRFDTQKLQNPEVEGVEYQQGELFGYEVREYLLEKWGRKCAYCDKENAPLQIDHIVPRARGGTDRVSNLTLACQRCNEKKEARPVEEFLKDDPDRLKSIKANAKAPLKDAAAVNSTRRALFEALQQTGLPLETGSGGRTKFNRTRQNYPKAHWIDAACTGESGAAPMIPEKLRPLSIRAIGHGSRQMCLMDKYGTPRTKPKGVKRVRGFQTGDLVRLVQPSGKYRGAYVGKVAVRERGAFDIQTRTNDKRIKITAPHHRFTLLQRGDGYAYEHPRAA
ncbi:MAG: HNH endonuclease [Gammaproteobacteria bacterium]|nr:HNH endonuclease [Gammaproteobacteria bacterium]MBU1655190.1 HNH endonuclease [Gammaproteobacteria bacterium]MBU1960001.1 HNH endonuclease [Gammaproteobacteria bacterium]